MSEPGVMSAGTTSSSSERVPFLYSDLRRLRQMLSAQSVAVKMPLRGSAGDWLRRILVKDHRSRGSSRKAIDPSLSLVARVTSFTTQSRNTIRKTDIKGHYPRTNSVSLHGGK